LQGDFGKPRPALVIQSDLFNEQHATVTVLPITSHIIGSPLFRITLEPSEQNGPVNFPVLARVHGMGFNHRPHPTP
jgi:mRNA-degrading endonuclease toxin of MazEF toxin-antitoxin module